MEITLFEIIGLIKWKAEKKKREYEMSLHMDGSNMVKANAYYEGMMDAAGILENYLNETEKQQ